MPVFPDTEQYHLTELPTNLPLLRLCEVPLINGWVYQFPTDAYIWSNDDPLPTLGSIVTSPWYSGRMTVVGYFINPHRFVGVHVRAEDDTLHDVYGLELDRPIGFTQTGPMGVGTRT